MKKFFVLVFICFSCFFISIQIDINKLNINKCFAKDKLIIATEGAYPPFNYVDKDGKLGGFDVDIAYALSKSMNKDCEIIAVKWEEIIDGLIAGKYDAIIASMAKTPEREKKIDFTDCYSRSSVSFVGKTTLSIKISQKDLKNKNIGCQEATFQQEYLEKEYKNIAHVKPYKLMEDAFKGLVKGEIDVLIADTIMIYDFLKKDEGKDFDFIGEPLPIDNPSNYAYIAVQKGNKKLVEEFNKALKIIRLDGTYEKINKKYFPFNTY